LIPAASGISFGTLARRAGAEYPRHLFFKFPIFAAVESSPAACFGPRAALCRLGTRRSLRIVRSGVYGNHPPETISANAMHPPRAGGRRAVRRRGQKCSHRAPRDERSCSPAAVRDQATFTSTKSPNSTIALFRQRRGRARVARTRYRPRNACRSTRGA
jgi:hypothetical protein